MTTQIHNEDNNEQENSLFQFTNNSFSFQVFSIALSSFYRKTELSGAISFQYVQKEDSVMINLSFSPRIPTDEEYFIFLEDLKIAERFVVGNSFLSYTEDLSDMTEVNAMKEIFFNETKASGIYLDIDMKVEK